MKLQTLFFSFAVGVYVGITAAVTFTASVHFAFGWVLGQLFLWAAWVAFVSWAITKVGLRHERAWWNARREGRGGTSADPEERRLRDVTAIRTTGDHAVKETGGLREK